MQGGLDGKLGLNRESTIEPGGRHTSCQLLPKMGRCRQKVSPKVSKNTAMHRCYSSTHVCSVMFRWLHQTSVGKHIHPSHLYSSRLFYDPRATDLATYVPKREKSKCTEKTREHKYGISFFHKAWASPMASMFTPGKMRQTARQPMSKAKTLIVTKLLESSWKKSFIQIKGHLSLPWGPQKL